MVLLHRLYIIFAAPIPFVGSMPTTKSAAPSGHRAPVKVLEDCDGEVVAPAGAVHLPYTAPWPRSGRWTAGLDMTGLPDLDAAAASTPAERRLDGWTGLLDTP